MKSPIKTAKKAPRKPASSPAIGAGRPAEIVRWTVEHAATEFGLDRRTLTALLRKRELEPGDDRRYSTRAICQAVFGENPRDEKDREQATNFRIKNDELRRLRIPIADTDVVWKAIFQSVAAALKSAKGKPLTTELINSIFALFRGAKLPC